MNDIDNPKQTILLNRGIENWKQYLNLIEDCTHDFNLLDNIDKAVGCFINHIEKKSRIHIIDDSDVDGYTSPTKVYRNIKQD